MLRRTNFLEEEKGSPLLLLDRGWLATQETDYLIGQVESWIATSGIEVDPSFSVSTTAPVTRIVERDVERIFNCDSSRSVLTRVLAHVQEALADYGQGVGYAAGWLLLFLDEATTVQVLLALDRNEKYIPGYWRAEAVKFVVDAKVVGELVGNFFGPLLGILEEQGVFPQTFAQKWFVGLGIQVLHFEALFVFWEHFMAEGYRWLFRFALAMFTACAEPLSQAGNTQEMYQILRLDEAIADDNLRAGIVEMAVQMELDGDFADTIAQLREHIYTTDVKPAMDKAAAFRANAAAEDADGEDDDEYEYDGDFVECGVCENNAPDVYCNTCALPICGMCLPKLKAKGKCSDDHDQTEDVEAAMAAAASASAPEGGAATEGGDAAATEDADADAAAPAADAAADADVDALADQVASLAIADGETADATDADAN